MSMPICLSCGAEADVEVLTPCPHCGGEQGAGVAGCALCKGDGQVAAKTCACPDGYVCEGCRNPAAGIVVVHGMSDDGRRCQNECRRPPQRAGGMVS